jgi:3-oxoacyl-[acyl-carrier-protein] synthase-3
MAFLRGFGGYLPSRIVDNTEIAAMTGTDADWIVQASGILERRFAAPHETIASMGVEAARDCLASAGVDAREVGLILVASGTAERRFPGPASAIGAGLGIGGAPAIDLPMASAGSLFAMTLAAQMAAVCGNVLVVASEIMSRVVKLDQAGRDAAILFGDGAGACLVGADAGLARIADSVLHTDGEFAEALQLPLSGPVCMDGRTVILQAARKLPAVIAELLQRNGRRPAEVATFLLHQANVNLIVRVAWSVKAPDEKFYRNIERYGNTSSASLLIAAAEWWRGQDGIWPGAVVFAAFGAGLNWGAVLAESE